MIEILNGELRQWDLGRKAVITPAAGETVDEVHCYGEDAENAHNVKLQPQDGKVLADIPNILLQCSQKISICAVMRSPDGCCRTTQVGQFYVWSRAKPDDYVYTETEVKNYATLREELLALIGQGGGGSTAKIGSVTLLAEAWQGEDNLYSQIVTVDGITENSQVDLTPNAEQLIAFRSKDLTFVTKNANGIVTVYAIGQKPQNDYTIQVTITEVTR